MLLASQVRAYKFLWKPKHHFCEHMVEEIKRVGPHRSYWCFSFEGYNQKLKRAARNSNYKDVSGRVAKRLCMKRAVAIARRKLACAMGVQ